jgi:hypothetical protein
MRSRVARMALPGGVLLAALAAAPTALAAAPPPCSPAVAARPVFTVTDAEDGRGDTRLTATHDIVVNVEFPPEGADGVDPRWSGPPGVPMLNQRSRGAREIDLTSPYDAGFQPPAAGPLPVTVSWQQSDGTQSGRCSSSASTTLNIEAARRIRVPRPRSLARSTEYTMSLAFGRDAHLGPVDVRLRSARGARFPGPRVPFRSARRVLRPTDTGTFRRQLLFTPFLRVMIESQIDPRGLLVTPLVRAIRTNPRLGYELELRQGGRRLVRIRAAGSCNAFGCVFPRVSFQR